MFDLDRYADKDIQLKVYQQIQIHRCKTILYICQGVFILVKRQNWQKNIKDE